MRILVPAVEYEDNFAENVAETLRTLGHVVATLGFVAHAAYWSLPRNAIRAVEKLISGTRPNELDRRTLSLARTFRPDMILALTQGIHPEVLDALGRLCSGRRVLWWGDSIANSKGWGVLDSGWDTVYLKDRVAVANLRVAGRNAHHLHEAMNPAWHRPLGTQSNGDVAVVGNSYEYRQAVCDRLLERGVALAIYGPIPPRRSSEAYRRAHSGRYVTREDKSRVFSEALACLNTFHPSEGDSLNCRAFEIAGAGGLQLIQYRPSVEECFSPGQEVLAFCCFEELLDHLDRAQRDPLWARRVREAGARRALSEHTYRHRLERILGEL